MKTVLLKIDESVLGDTDTIVSAINISRNKYIIEAINYYNKLQRRRALEVKMKLESAMVREESLNVLKEFEGIDYVD
jgi:hypothetical protein